MCHPRRVCYIPTGRVWGSDGVQQGVGLAQGARHCEIATSALSWVQALRGEAGD